MNLSEEAKDNLRWWLQNENQSPMLFGSGHVHLRFQSDASLAGWGCANVTNSISTGGRWSESEKSNHINYLELLACLLGLQSFLKDMSHRNIHIQMDNTVALAYVRNMGGKIRKLDHLAKELWLWAKSKHLQIITSHIPGIDNRIADN